MNHRSGAMQGPSCRLPGTVYMVTRRTERRVHPFRPDALMNQTFLYRLGVALQGTVRLISAVLMSNHYHLTVVDTEGRVPELVERRRGLASPSSHQAHR